jgi:hypothetical protein
MTNEPWIAEQNSDQNWRKLNISRKRDGGVNETEAWMGEDGGDCTSVIGRSVDANASRLPFSEHRHQLNNLNSHNGIFTEIDEMTNLDAFLLKGPPSGNIEGGLDELRYLILTQGIPANSEGMVSTSPALAHATIPIIRYNYPCEYLSQLTPTPHSPTSACTSGSSSSTSPPSPQTSTWT